ncbi:MAG TPA: hypothetical protein VE172_02055 [Stackebrandtia sp.]|jgi:hypothetical protein|uniref:hypothetical protein n=1 Tax=Stackebrandtia sp. TaxID=2023065 RepID=UPI002D5CC494|nr:hypothetical protein [Stackebrandtia sp.]HZE37569.1 hypothetical protein [Stackebrandtia sp.]
MIPQLVTVRYRRRDGRWRRWFVPVVPIVLVLSPLLVLAVVGGVIACLVFRMSAWGALRGAGRVLWSLPGTRFDLEDGHEGVRVSIR